MEFDCETSGILVLLPESLNTPTLLKLDSLLEVNGLEIQDIFVLKLNRAIVNSIRGYTLNSNTWRPILVRGLLDYSSDSILLYVKGSNNEFDSCQEYISSLKGAALNLEMNPNSFRSQLNSWSPILKFIHTPDNYRELIREFSIFRPHLERIKTAVCRLSDLLSYVDEFFIPDFESSIKELISKQNIRDSNILLSLLSGRYFDRPHNFLEDLKKEGIFLQKKHLLSILVGMTSCTE